MNKLYFQQYSVEEKLDIIDYAKVNLFFLFFADHH